MLKKKLFINVFIMTAKILLTSYTIIVSTILYIFDDKKCSGFDVIRDALTIVK